MMGGARAEDVDGEGDGEGICRRERLEKRERFEFL